MTPMLQYSQPSPGADCSGSHWPEPILKLQCLCNLSVASRPQTWRGSPALMWKASALLQYSPRHERSTLNLGQGGENQGPAVNVPGAQLPCCSPAAQWETWRDPPIGQPQGSQCWGGAAAHTLHSHFDALSAMMHIHEQIQPLLKVQNAHVGSGANMSLCLQLRVS